MNEKTPKFEVIKGGIERLSELVTEIFQSLPEDFKELVDGNEAQRIREEELTELDNSELVDILSREDRWSTEEANRTYAALDETFWRLRQKVGLV